MAQKSPYETYSQWEQRTFCDNAARRGTGVSVTPQCLEGKREYEAKVTYDNGETSTMTLCQECLQALKRDVRKYWKTRKIRYKVEAKRLT